MEVEKFAIRKSFEKNVKVLKFFGLIPLERFPSIFQLYFFFYYILFIIPTPVLSAYEIWLTEPEERMKKVTDNVFMVMELAVQLIKSVTFLRSPKKVMYSINIWKKNIFTTYTDLDKKIVQDDVNEYNFTFISFISVCVIYVASLTVQTYFNRSRLCLDIWLPFEAINDLKIYLIVTTYIYLTLIHGALINISMDTLISGNMLYCATQLKILKNRIQNMDDYIEEDMNKISQDLTQTEREIMINNLIYNRIIKCVDIYNSVSRYAKELEATFSTLIFSQFLAHVVVISMILLQISKIDVTSFAFLSMVLFLIPMLMECLLFCYYGNRLYEESMTFNEAIFKSPWYNFEPRSKKSLMILMEFAKRPIKLTAGKVLDLSLETFILILRRSYGLLALLKNY